MRANDRALAGFTGLGHGALHGFELSIPVFVPIWLAAFDVSPAIIGIVVGAGYALVGLGAPIAGVLADRYGSRRLVLASIGGMTVAFTLLSVVESVFALGIVLVVWGAAASLYHPAGLSLISRTADRRGTVLAYHGIGGNLGMVLLPLVTILLLAFFDWRTVVLLIAVPAAVCVAIGVFLPVDDRNRTEPSRSESTRSGEASGPETDATADGGASKAPSTRRRLLDRLGAFVSSSRGLLVGGFLFVFAIQMVYGTYYRGIFTFLPDVLEGLPVFEPIPIGNREIEAGQLAYSGLLLVGAGGQYVGGALADRIDAELALLGTFVVLVAASIAFVPAANAGLLALVAICVVLGFFIYAFAPIGQTLVAEYAPDEYHGLSFGYVYLGTFGVGAIGAALAGAAIDVGGTALLFALLATLAVICTAIAVVLFRRSR